MDIYKKEKRKVERCISENKEETNEQFGRKINQYVVGSKVKEKRLKVLVR